MDAERIAEIRAQALASGEGPMCADPGCCPILALLAEVERLTAERDALAATIERVRGLHRPAIHVEPGSPCLACGWPYPCSTVRALDGEVE